MKIGVMLGCLRSGFEGGLAAARELGIQGVQLTLGDLSGIPLDEAGKKKVRETVASYGLEISALCGGGPFTDASKNPGRVEEMKKLLDLSVDLGPAIVTSHIGEIPDDPDALAWKAAREALSEVGSYGEKIGAVFAIETGPEPPEVLAKLLSAIGSPGIGINLDPANFIIYGGWDPVRAVELLGPHIVHTHAKDARFISPTAPLGQKEVPLGQGEVPFPRYIAALRAAGFDGYLAIEREVGANPKADIAAAVNFLKALI